MMTGGGGGGRVATWRERENNKRRERRRRAIAARIFAGLRAHGSSCALAGSHADNNELLKALCRQAGWTVLDDGTTFRATTNGCKPPPPPERIAATAPASTTMSPSPSSFPSPTRPENSNPNPNPSSTVEPSFLLPFLRNLSSLPPLRFSTSAPAVTPPLSSPAPAAEAEARPAKLQRLDSDSAAFLRRGAPISFASAPASPARRPNESDASTVDFGLWGGALSTAPASPTFNLVHTAPAAVGVGELEHGKGRVVVKPWKGEKIHEVGVDELELTLGVGRNDVVGRGGGGGVKF